jgi:hypothetical protein
MAHAGHERTRYTQWKLTIGDASPDRIEAQYTAQLGNVANGLGLVL